MAHDFTPNIATGLAANSWYGCYYAADNPTIEIIDCLHNGPIGASVWGVVDGAKGGTTMSTALAAAASSGATTISTEDSIPLASYVNIGGESILTKGVSGTGPYNITLATPLAANHASGASVLAVVPLASGTCSPLDLSITVATGGEWVSGGSVGVNQYHFYCDATSLGVCGGGVTEWHQGAPTTVSSGGANDVETWWGVVEQAGASTVYVSVGTQSFASRIDEFSSSASAATWSQVAASTQDNASSTTVAFPSLTASSGNLYVGCAAAPATFTAGTTSGFTWPEIVNGGVSAIFCYDPNTSVGAIAPTTSISAANTSGSAGLLLAPSSGTVSHVAGWEGNTLPHSVTSYTVNVSPQNVGDVLVLSHVCTDGASNGGILTADGPPQGCYFNVAPSTNLFKPVGSGGAGYTATTTNENAVNAWLGTAHNRENYNDGNGDGTGASSVTAQACYTQWNRTDPCYSGAWLDSARPRRPWMNSAYQGGDAVAWNTTITNMVAAGNTGWCYELPSNEPENGGLSQATTISYCNTAYSQITSVDPTAKVGVFCSGGVPEDTSYAGLAAILAGVTHFDEVMLHDENTLNNQMDLVTLRLKWGALHNVVKASPNPTAMIWATETGMEGGYVGVYHPRRHAAQATKFLLVREQFGYAKEYAWFFKNEVTNAVFTGVVAGFIESSGGDAAGGSPRLAAYCVHIMSEALYGTTCTPTSLPTQLSFGPSNSVADQLFYGLQYHSPSQNRDVVVLATNGIGYTANETVVLECSSTDNLTVWNGVGQDITSDCTIDGNHVTVPVDDLLTYVFLPLDTTVRVLDTGSKAISVLSQLPDLIAQLPSGTNESGAAVKQLNWANTEAASYGVGPGSPYTDTTLPATITYSGWGTNPTFGGYAVKGMPPWNPAGATPIAFSIQATVNGTPTTLVDINNPSAFSVAMPGSLCNDTCTATTYWDHTFAWIGNFAETGAATQLKLTCTQASYNGEPDTLSSAIASAAFNYDFPQVFNLSRWAMYSALPPAINVGEYTS